MENWLQNNVGNEVCPNCKAQWHAATRVNRLVQDSLDKTLFNCDKCSQQFIYKERHFHWSGCGVGFKCVVDDCAEKLESENELV